MSQRAGPLSLPRSRRLRGKAEIQRLFEQGQRDRCATMTVLWRERSGPGRVAFAVGRRVGGAVERNRGRRRMREAFRRQANGMPEGVDVVLIGRGEVLSRPFPALVEDVATLLRAIRETVGQRRGRGREARP